jgi:penicillin-binding protein 1A
MANGVTPLQLAAAYGAFANNGVYIEPTAVRKVEKLDGTVLVENVPQQHRAMKETTAFLITDMLKDAVNQGTGTRARLDRPAAGKTGTADNKNNQTSDIWFAGYTPDLVGITWIGNKNQNYRLNPGSYGGNYTAMMWKDMMQKAHAGLAKRNFPSAPAGIVRATVDSKSGLLPGSHTPDDHLVTDYFVQGSIPAQTDNTHVLMEVCATSGQLPSEYCTDRITKVVIKLPYSTPNFVGDYSLRAPTEICSMHSTSEGDGDWLPDLPDNNSTSPSPNNNSNSWMPPANENNEDY